MQSIKNINKGIKTIKNEIKPMLKYIVYSLFEIYFLDFIPLLILNSVIKEIKVIVNIIVKKGIIYKNTAQNNASPLPGIKNGCIK